MEKKSALAKVAAWVTDKVRSQDYYGKPVMLTFNGEESYNTITGGAFSICIKSIVIAYMVMLIIVMVNKDQTKGNKYSLLKDLSDDSEVHYIGNHGISFALSMTNSGIDYLNSPNYLTFEINQIQQTWTKYANGTSTYTRTRTPISYSKCGTHFGKAEIRTVERLGIDQYYCPQNLNYTISGVFDSPNFQYIEVRLIKCKGSTTCKSDAEINTAVANLKLSMATMNTY